MSFFFLTKTRFTIDTVRFFPYLYKERNGKRQQEPMTSRNDHDEEYHCNHYPNGLDQT